MSTTITTPASNVITASIIATVSTVDGIENPSIEELDSVGHTLGVISCTSPEGKRFNVVAASAKTEEEIAALPVLKGSMFIIPNTALSPSSYWGQEAFDELVSDHVNSAAKVLDLRTHDLSKDRMVQVWVHSSECENWGDHIHPVIGRFPSHVPAKWLEGLAEGDTLAIVGHKAKMLIRCQQHGYRYQRFGTFEQVLKQVNKDYVPQA